MQSHLSWFRLYCEFAFDPKIQTLPEMLQRRYIMLLCLKCHGDIPGLDNASVACALRITPEELQKTKIKLVEIGLLTENYDIPQWEKRQYVSDSSTPRVTKYRREHNVTFRKRSGNGHVTKVKHPTSVSVSDSVSSLKEEKREDILSGNANQLVNLFLGTLSTEFVEKFKDHDKWRNLFDKLLKEFDVDRLKVLILFYRRDNFWSTNFMSPMKLTKKNKDGIRYVDYFFERMKGSNKVSDVPDYSSWDVLNKKEGK